MKRKLVVLLAIMAVVCWATVAGASISTFTVDTTETGGNAVQATAIFTTGAGTLTVDLYNTLVNPKTVAQNISDLFFTLSSGQTSGTLSSSSGNERNVADDGTYSAGGSGVSTGWVLNGLHLDGLGSAADVPAHTIIGLPNGSGNYSNANSSIAGNDPHNPFLFGTAGGAGSSVEFVISIAGLTAADFVTAATFSFGTTSGDNVPGTPGGDNPVPIPPSALLLGSGLLGLVGLRKFKKI